MATMIDDKHAASQAPRVSIVVPVYNMERYLAHCLEALCGQTLEDIEIIAVNDGSTDSSPDILQRFAARDGRIRIIDKPNSGYGASMNRGIAEARGEYIGIVEPDDFPDRAMFGKLYALAVQHDCDLVKCNYYEHYEDHESIMRVFDGFAYGTPFDPAGQPSIICTIPAIWAGIYRREMLEREGVRFRETPGASFQDTGFTLKAWMAARRVALVRRPLLHYRMDNPGSSVKTADKAMAVCDELAEAEAFMRARPVRCGAFAPWFHVGKWGKYRWNYRRVDASMRLDFARRMHDEFSQAQAAGELVMGLFGDNGRAQLAFLLVEGPEAFVARYEDGVPDDWETDPHAAALLAGVEGDGALGEPSAVAALARDAVPAGPSPAVTVMVAAYECEDYIDACLSSLKAQTFGDFEVIVVDDASGDATVARARAAMGDDARFSLVERAVNGGPGAARNVALERARGEFVMYLDSDDRLVADALEKLVGKARRQNLDELYFSAQSFYDSGAAVNVMNEDFSGRTPYEGVATGRELFTFFSDRGEYFTQGALRMVRRALLEREGIRFPEGIIHEDVLYGFRILVASARSSFLDEPLYLRRQRVGSIMDSSRRSVDNVRGHVESILFVRAWVAAHADELDDAFVRAVGREVGLWSQIAAHDWRAEMTEEQRRAFIDGVSPADRLALQFDILGMGEASERAAAEWRESLTYRLGDMVATVPRFARLQAKALLGKRRADRM